MKRGQSSSFLAILHMYPTPYKDSHHLCIWLLADMYATKVIISMEADSNDDCESHSRVQTGNRIKYLVVEPETIDPDMLLPSSWLSTTSSL